MGEREKGFMFDIYKYWQSKDFNLGFDICKENWNGNVKYYIMIMFGFIGFVIGYKKWRIPRMMWRKGGWGYVFSSHKVDYKWKRYLLRGSRDCVEWATNVLKSKI